MATAVIPVSVIEADWSGDGTFASAGTIGALAPYTIAALDPRTIADLDGVGAGPADLAPDALADPGASAERGRDQIAALSPPLADELTLVLDNRDGRYSPENAASPLYPTADVGLEVRWRMTVGATSYPVCRGRAVEWRAEGAVGRPRVGVRALSQLGQLVGRRGYSTSLYGDGTAAGAVRTDVALGRVLDAAGLTDPARRRFDAGDGRLLWFWIDPDDDLFDLATRIWASEGPGARLYDDADGVTVFRSRSSEITDPRATAVQTTFQDTDDGTTPWYAGYTPDAGDRGVVNRCTVTTVQRAEDAADSVVARFDAAITLAAGETRDVAATTASGDPATTTAPPVAGTDYTVTAGSLVSATLTAWTGPVIGIRLVAGGAGATVANLAARGRLLRRVGSTVVRDQGVDTAASRRRFGERNLSPPVAADVAVLAAQDFCNAVVSRFQTPRPRAALTVPLGTDANAAAVLERRMMDRVAVVNDPTRLARAMFVESVRYLHRGGVPVAEVRCEAAVDLGYALWDTGHWDSDKWGI